MKALMSLDEAAAETPWGKDTIRAAVNRGDLLAKRHGGRRQIVIRDVDLREWIDRMEDA